MSLQKFKERWPENVSGSFYVDSQCLDCDLCRELVPTVFARKAEGGYSYVKKQPETADEIAGAKQAVEGCCTEAISADGASFDWDAIPPVQSGPDGTLQPSRKRWWQFWRDR